MNILIGLLVILLLAHGLSGYSATVEERNARATQAVPAHDLDDYQRGECESWRGWPKHYQPWFCEGQP